MPLDIVFIDSDKLGLIVGVRLKFACGVFVEVCVDFRLHLYKVNVFFTITHLLTPVVLRAKRFVKADQVLLIITKRLIGDCSSETVNQTL